MLGEVALEVASIAISREFLQTASFRIPSGNSRSPFSALIFFYAVLPHQSSHFAISLLLISSFSFNLSIYII